MNSHISYYNAQRIMNKLKCHANHVRSVQVFKYPNKEKRPSFL